MGINQSLQKHGEISLLSLTSFILSIMCWLYFIIFNHNSIIYYSFPAAILSICLAAFALGRINTKLVRGKVITIMSMIIGGLLVVLFLILFVNPFVQWVPSELKIFEIPIK